ncbi:hypothetical protein [uncultured Victivallis sp.]|uniref:hypothetical protein n=1 Tax=uncultured Victivallis sp. TaxID=354118 RepID=UPI0025E58FDE|nr:hypothetical protein [uncultured Victivallis sp.]
MGTCIFYEFLVANKFPKDPHFCHNALVFAPDKTVLQSLKEIQTFDKSKVVPPEYVSWLDANLKFAFLDDAALSLQILENSEYNIIISNTQKIILKQSHKEKTAVDELFSADNTYVRVEKEGAENSSTAGFEDLYNFDTEVETEEELIANQRFEMLKRLNNLGIYVDEAHHAFGDKLEKDFAEKGSTSLRKTINELAACLRNAGSSVVACYNYTGTPYVKNMLLPEVYAYSLKDAIDKYAPSEGHLDLSQTVWYVLPQTGIMGGRHGTRRTRLLGGATVRILGQRLDDSRIQRTEGTSLRKHPPLDPSVAKDFEVHRFSYCIRNQLTPTVYYCKKEKPNC